LRRPAPTRPESRLTEAWLAALATAAAASAWIYWLRAGLVLSHYDAKAHLVVARRVFDNLTPGWQQIGAVWLPLPHLINLLPTQIDLFYRTGAFASAVSIACFGITAWAAARLIRESTGSVAGAVVATALLALNPNLLYLHATPMTEPLLLATTFVFALWLYEWLGDRTDMTHVPWQLDTVLFAAAWTRYEAWFVIAAGFVATAIVLWRRGATLSRIIGIIARLSVWPGMAVAIFVVDSRITVGAWFVSDGFFVPDPTYKGLAVKSLLALWWGTHRMSGYLIEVVAIVGAIVALTHRRLIVATSVFATGLLPFYAFVHGHPFRIRYMIPLVAACALFGGLSVGLLARRHRAAALVLGGALLASTLIESPPWHGRLAPMVEEAQWDYPASLERRAVTRCLAPAYHGEKVLASMGSLAHYMQELSAEGFGIADFINEGNGSIWDAAMETGPAPHAGWMLVEERAEGGDVLAQRIRADAAFARGMTRVCEGGGVALYRRDGAPGDARLPARVD
jgi:hypothetical protein